MKEIMSNSKILQYGVDDVEMEKVETRFQGFFKLDVYSLTHKLYSGEQSETMAREIFERGDAVVLMPYDPVTDCVILQEQFRPGAVGRAQSPWMLEFVAGMFGKNEQPIDVAIREAEEEAGLIIPEQDVLPVCQYFSSPGGTTEYLHVYVGKVDATKAGGVFGLPEEGEDILVHVVTREYALKLLAEGKILNAATIIGLQWLALNYQSLQQQWLP
ncbi:MAG: NUDIX domain-containing protein [Thalassotalea sp.]